MFVPIGDGRFVYSIIHVSHCSSADYFWMVWDAYVRAYNLGEDRLFDNSINVKQKSGPSEVNAMTRRVRKMREFAVLTS